MELLPRRDVPWAGRALQKVIRSGTVSARLMGSDVVFTQGKNTKRDTQTKMSLSEQMSPVWKCGGKKKKEFRRIQKRRQATVCIGHKNILGLQGD